MTFYIIWYSRKQSFNFNVQRGAEVDVRLPDIRIVRRFFLISVSLTWVILRQTPSQFLSSRWASVTVTFCLMISFRDETSMEFKHDFTVRLKGCTWWERLYSRVRYFVEHSRKKLKTVKKLFQISSCDENFGACWVDSSCVSSSYGGWVAT